MYDTGSGKHFWESGTFSAKDWLFALRERGLARPHLLSGWRLPIFFCSFLAVDSGLFDSVLTLLFLTSPFVLRQTEISSSLLLR